MERFIKLDGRVYYESELNLMSNKQLEALIEKCQRGIKDVERKRNDYENVSYDPKNPNHYYDVLKNFNTVSVYLQADIVMINKILKSRKDECVSELDWYKTYFKVTSEKLMKFKWQKMIKETNSRTNAKFEFEV